MKTLLMAMGIVLILGSSIVAQDIDEPFGGDSNAEIEYVETIEFKVAKSWLYSKPNLRMATIEDYEKVDKDVFDFFYPISEVGDFNGDRYEDFAVILVNKGKSQPFSFAIFNGPFDLKKKQKPALFIPNIERNYGISYFTGELSLTSTTNSVVLNIIKNGDSYKVKKGKSEKREDDFDF